MRKKLIEITQAGLPPGVHQPAGRRDRLPPAQPGGYPPDRLAGAGQGGKTAGGSPHFAAHTTEAAIDLLAAEGYDPDMGARHCAGIQFRIEDKISDFFLSGEVVDGDTVLVDAPMTVKSCSSGSTPPAGAAGATRLMLIKSTTAPEWCGRLWHAAGHGFVIFLNAVFKAPEAVIRCIIQKRIFSAKHFIENNSK